MSKEKNRPAQEPEFKTQLRENILAAICELRKGGTVGMTAQNLLQVVQTPSVALRGAPKGTNAPWAYAELFFEVCKESKLRPFVIEPVARKIKE